jgi:hypothetical protein
MEEAVKEEFERLHARFDKLEDKIDGHLERLTRAEEAILWIRGHLNTSTAVFLAVVGSIAAWIFKQGN